MDRKIFHIFYSLIKSLIFLSQGRQAFYRKNIFLLFMLFTGNKKYLYMLIQEISFYWIIAVKERAYPILLPMRGHGTIKKRKCG